MSPILTKEPKDIIKYFKNTSECLEESIPFVEESVEILKEENIDKKSALEAGLVLENFRKLQMTVHDKYLDLSEDMKKKIDEYERNIQESRAEFYDSAIYSFHFNNTFKKNIRSLGEEFPDLVNYF